MMPEAKKPPPPSPGPWDVNKATNLDGVEHILVCVQSNGAPVAHLYHNGVETRPNARLIAAAPELLQALQALVDMDVGYRRGPKVYEAVEAARAAIAKATGGEA